MSHRRRSSVTVADVIVPQHLLSVGARTSTGYATQRRPSLRDLPEDDDEAAPHVPVRHRPVPVDPNVEARERQGSFSTSAARPRNLSIPMSPQDGSFGRTIETIPEQEQSPPVFPVRFNLEGQPSKDDYNEKTIHQIDPKSTEVDEEADTISNYDYAPDETRQSRYVPDEARQSKRRTIMEAIVPDSVRHTARNIAEKVRKGSMFELHEKAKAKGIERERKPWMQLAFEYTFYLFLLAFVYFILVGMPLWKGSVYWMYILVKTKFVLTGGWAITMGIALLYAFSPLLILFEKDPPTIEHPPGDYSKIPGVEHTALLIPCYKSAKIIGPTLVAALKVFPAKNIFVLANGNSETPLDNTEEVCQEFGVNHTWCPVGSKIVAQFVGCYVAKDFKDVLLIDDDCAIPPNFPIVSERLTGRVKCIGYTIKSVGPNSSKGTWCTQAQDLEYKLSGLQRAFSGIIGSATFPHGAISLWDRKFLIETFYDHPGFSVSEDWFFGHSCRRLGGRIKMCSAIFVETETPDALFFGNGGDRGGFGEMTVFKQRFTRWNFFFVNGIFYNLGYIFFSWQLGWWEIGAKIIVFQEVYETLIYLITPFVLPICFVVNPIFSAYLFAATMGMYLVNTVIFNELHLRLRNERVGVTMLFFYYMPYKFVLTLVNVASCYWALFKYATYFAKPHLKIIEDEKAVGVVLQLDEEVPEPGSPSLGAIEEGNEGGFRGRSMVINAVGSRISMTNASRLSMAGNKRRSRMSMGPGSRMSMGPGSRMSMGPNGRMSMGPGSRISVLNQGQLVYLPGLEPIGQREMNFIAGSPTQHVPLEHGQISEELDEKQEEQLHDVQLHDAQHQGVQHQDAYHPGAHQQDAHAVDQTPAADSTGNDDHHEPRSHGWRSTWKRTSSWAQSNV